MKIRQIVQLISRMRELFRTATKRLQVTLPIKAFQMNIEEDEDKDHSILSWLGYSIGERLGEGSFSHVVKAYSQQHRRDVAVKIINKTKIPELYMEKFLPKEIELIKVLSHKHIVKFLNMKETKSFIYIIMNLAAKGNLLEVILENGYIDENRACHWFHHLVDGIAFCHRRGVAHRDLKCDNLLLDECNVLKITDFTFARVDLPQYIIDNEGNVDRSILLRSTFCGSYAYACPEILLREPYQPHLADVWSMGVILYAMLSGRLPFDDTSLKTLLEDIRKPVRFSEHPILSEDAKILILKILSPSGIRIYIPRIRKNSWYINSFQKIEDGNNRENSFTASESFTSSPSEKHFKRSELSASESFADVIDQTKSEKNIGSSEINEVILQES